MTYYSHCLVIFKFFIVCMCVYHMCLRYLAHIVRHGSKHFYSMSYLAVPYLVLFFLFSILVIISLRLIFLPPTQHFLLSCICFISFHVSLLSKQGLSLLGCWASPDFSREDLHAVNVNSPRGPPRREFL